jgi:hypothetical protein
VKIRLKPTGYLTGAAPTAARFQTKQRITLYLTLYTPRITRLIKRDIELEFTRKVKEA